MFLVCSSVPGMSLLNRMFEEIFGQIVEQQHIPHFYWGGEVQCAPLLGQNTNEKQVVKES